MPIQVELEEKEKEKSDVCKEKEDQLRILQDMVRAIY